SDPGIHHFLLPLDGSPLSEQIIEPAAQLAKLMPADCTLLRVVVQAVYLFSPAEGGTLGERTESLIELMNEATQKERLKAGEYLERIAGQMRTRGLTVQTRVVVESQPAAAILQAATPPAVDGIALASHGRHGLPRLVLGSVADKVIRGTPLPVLVYRPV